MQCRGAFLRAIVQKQATRNHALRVMAADIDFAPLHLLTSHCFFLLRRTFSFPNRHPLDTAHRPTGHRHRWCHCHGPPRRPRQRIPRSAPREATQDRRTTTFGASAAVGAIPAPCCVQSASGFGRFPRWRVRDCKPQHLLRQRQWRRSGLEQLALHHR